MPDLFIISGSNGAGKSTIGKDYIPHHITKASPVFDGDKLYMQKHLELWKSGMRTDKHIRELANEYVADTFKHLVEEAISGKKVLPMKGIFRKIVHGMYQRFLKRKGIKYILFFSV